MTADTVLTHRLEDVANALVEAITDHEAHVHAGEPCKASRASALATLALRLGFRSEGEALLIVHQFGKLRKAI